MGGGGCRVVVAEENIQRRKHKSGLVSAEKFTHNKIISQAYMIYLTTLFSTGQNEPKTSV